MANACFKGAGYTGELDTVFITRFEIGPMPPRARLFDRAVVVEECRKFQEVAHAFLVSQDWMKPPPDPQELIPEVVATTEPKEPCAPMEVLIWFCGFVILDGAVVFRVEIRSSKKLPTKARKLVGDTLSKALKALVGIIERRGGCPGDLVPATDIAVAAAPKEAPLPMNPEIPEIP